MPRLPRRRFAALAGASLAALPLSSARAQAWPAKPLRLIVPYPPGGTTDTLARVIAGKLAEPLGQPVLVDNKAGAAGNIGTDLAAKAPADGHTLCLGNNSTHATNQTLFPNAGFDAARDFAGISLVATVTHVLVAHPDFAAKSLAALIADAKARPGKIDYASSSPGSASHLAMELFKGALGIDLTHVPYKGVAPAVQDLVAGQVPVGFMTLPAVKGQIDAGKLRALAVTSAKRHPTLPDAPTIAEAAIPGFLADAWFGVFAPKGVAPAIIARLNAEIHKALAAPDARDAIVKAGFDIVTSTPAETDAFVTAEIAKWAGVVKRAGVKAE
ncbi:MAG: tripartite tricarboxylate transporter substrate binding protein [Rhodospirillales bacterium]|nr:MAG: tripartite tricarboxylate transporter substrate binding protein [Rhodospirillales bacterium]